MPWRVGALTKALLCGDIHAGIGRCQGLVGTGTDALPSMAATRRRGGSRLFRISWWGFAAASPERSATCVTGRSCPFGRSRPPVGVPAVLPPRFIAPGCLPCCGAVRLEGDAVCFGTGDLVAASEVDGTQEALRSGREEGVGGFKRSYGGPLPLVRSMRALRACPGAGGAGFTNQGLPTAP